MADVYATITEQESAVQEKIAGILELRAAEPAQREMLEAYLSKIKFPQGARVLEVGCGTGAISRELSVRPGISQTVGVDPCSMFLEKAVTLSSHLKGLSFKEGDAYSLPFEENSFDVVVYHTVLCHLADPELALQEAFRVLCSEGLLAIFDGDYSTTTLGTGEFDPLQCCASAAMEALVLNRWLVRKFPALLKKAGFKLESFNSHGYLQSSDPGYMLSLVDRGADVLVSSGQIGPALATALKDEARRRVEFDTFFGHISYASLICIKAA